MLIILHPTSILLCTICPRSINTQTKFTCPLPNSIVVINKPLKSLHHLHHEARHQSSCRQAPTHYLNRISYTNHQQKSLLICFLSSHTKTPKAFQQYSSHSLQGTLSPTAPTPNPNSRTYPNHPSGPPLNSKKKVHLLQPQPTQATTKINNIGPHTTKNSHISQKKSRSLHQKETECQLKQTKQPHNPTYQPHNPYQENPSHLVKTTFSIPQLQTTSHHSKASPNQKQPNKY